MERGRALLAEAERRVRDAGVSGVEVRLRHGGLVDTLHEIESEFRLVVLGKRGEHVDFAKAHLGGSVEQVVRASALPVLMATRAFKPVKRIVLAFDGGPSARKAVDFLVSEPRLRAFDCHVVTAGHPRDAEISPRLADGTTVGLGRRSHGAPDRRGTRGGHHRLCRGQ